MSKHNLAASQFHSTQRTHICVDLFNERASSSSFFSLNVDVTHWIEQDVLMTERLEALFVRNGKVFLWYYLPYNQDQLFVFCFFLTLVKKSGKYGFHLVSYQEKILKHRIWSARYNSQTKSWPPTLVNTVLLEQTHWFTYCLDAFATAAKLNSWNRDIICSQWLKYWLTGPLKKVCQLLI